jgi:hypothetical protein
MWPSSRSAAASAAILARAEYKENGMVEHGDDAAHCSNGLTAQKFRDASGEERAIYRRWMRGHHRNAVPDRGRHAVDELFQCQPDQLSSLSKSTSPLARGRQLAAPGR